MRILETFTSPGPGTRRTFESESLSEAALVAIAGALDDRCRRKANAREINMAATAVEPYEAMMPCRLAPSKDNIVVEL